MLAADQFIIRPRARRRAARLGGRRRRPDGDRRLSLVHRLGPRHHDRLEGLTLATRRFREAGYILRTFGQYVRDGLIPNLFPEGDREGLYHTADATLWFFHAMERYTQATGEEETLRKLLPIFVDIIDHHLKGTRFGIHIDPADGLFTQGADGYQLTWMDAKVDDWVVTPRRGKAVELNVLWHNALCLMQSWTANYGGGEQLAGTAGTPRARRSTVASGEKTGYLFDVVDGPQKRPGLPPQPDLRDCLTASRSGARQMGSGPQRCPRPAADPVGLRSLAPGGGFQAAILRRLAIARAAYHRGTVWGMAHRRVHRRLSGCTAPIDTAPANCSTASRTT